MNRLSLGVNFHFIENKFKGSMFVLSVRIWGKVFGLWGKVFGLWSLVVGRWSLGFGICGFWVWVWKMAKSTKDQRLTTKDFNPPKTKD
jgi:hypothetical protein